jgi:hypothetical protein
MDSARLLPKHERHLVSEWERRLTPYGLSLECLTTQGMTETTAFSNGVPHLQFHAFDAELDGHWKSRVKMGTGEGFDWASMHRIPTHYHSRKRPEWSLSDLKLRTYIDHRFPKWRDDSRQRECAARVLAILYLVLRCGLSSGATSEILRLTEGTVQTKISVERSKAEEFFRVAEPDTVCNADS